MATVRKGDVGIVLEITVTEEGGAAIDLSTATVKEIHFRPPSGTVKSVDAAFKTDGKDGLLLYTTVDGDLDEEGKWQLQVYIEMGGGKWHSSATSFTVDAAYIPAT